MGFKFREFCQSILIFMVVLLAGCSSSPGLYSDSVSAEYSGYAENRMIIKNASITIEVKDTDGIGSLLAKLLEEQEGFLVSSRLDDDGEFYATIKVPSSSLDKTLSLISGFGKEISKTVSARDITDEYRDQEAELNNLKSLRERLRTLLDKAVTVRDVLEVEDQLNRVQTKIDQIEGRLKSLKNQVMYSSVDITAREKTIYGPIGYLGKGVWWVIEKLFVIQ